MNRTRWMVAIFLGVLGLMIFRPCLDSDSWDSEDGDSEYALLNNP